MVVDVFIWSYEREAVDIRIASLKDTVDLHVAVQATNDFRGRPRIAKPLDLHNKNVIDVIVTIPDGLDAWQSEVWLRDRALIEATKVCPVDTWYIVSDGDEIPHPWAIKAAIFNDRPVKLMTDYRNFYADLRAIDHILEHQPTMAKLPDYRKAGGANSARWYSGWDSSNFTGWHLSSLGDTSKEKLETFAHIEYDKKRFKNNLDYNRVNMKDFLGRFDMEWTNDIPLGVPDHLLGREL